jgi:hypothetical protein
VSILHFLRRRSRWLCRPAWYHLGTTPGRWALRGVDACAGEEAFAPRIGWTLRDVAVSWRPGNHATSVTSIVSGVGIVWLLGGSRTVALSMAPKAVTTPIGLAISQEIGGVRH